MTASPKAAPVNLVVRFGIELVALTALGFWGWELGANTVLSVVLAVALPVAMAVIWGAFVAPRAPRRLSDPARLLVEVVLLAAATIGIGMTAGPLLAVGFGVVVVVNIALLFAWGQRRTA